MGQGDGKYRQQCEEFCDGAEEGGPLEGLCHHVLIRVNDTETGQLYDGQTDDIHPECCGSSHFHKNLPVLMSYTDII